MIWFQDFIKILILPPDASILIYYIEAFEGEMRYQLRDKEPRTLNGAMETVEKIDKNMQSSGKSNLPGFSIGYYHPPCSCLREVDP